MEKDALDIEAEQKLRENISPKILQKIEILESTPSFLKDASVLKEKYPALVAEYNDNLQKIWQRYDEMLANAGIWDKIKSGEITPKNPADISTLLTPKDLEEIGFLMIKAYKPFEDKNFSKDEIDLCKKYDCFPIDYWKQVIQIFVATGHFFSPTPFFAVGLASHTALKDMDDILKLPKDLNFGIKIEDNKETKEPELFVQIFENTSLRDLENNWHIVAKQQKKLKEKKGVDKKFYPLKNLDKAKRIEELRKQGKSDWEIQEEIYGEVGDVDFGKIENKRKGWIKQIRNFYKKIIK
ncbi:MAG: hypothetical protein ABSA74_00210 [Candidatus Staskawiczbacteria bacterium]|jgi:hypothetical protein